MNRQSTKLSKRHLSKVLKSKIPKQIPKAIEDNFEEMGFDNSVLADLNEWLLTIEQLGLGDWSITEIYEAFDGLLVKRHKAQRKSKISL